MSRTSPIALLAAMTLCAAAPAQAAAVRADVAGVFAHGDALLAVGERYRAVFDSRGVTFRPALGEHAPRAHRFELRTVSVRRGARVLLTTADHDAAIKHDRRAVTYRWPGVVEHFEARTDGLKHAFTLDERPTGEGDLVVALSIGGTLPSTDANAWLDGDGFGVTLGDVVGIDADGRRCVGGKRLVDGGVELSLPHAFVQAARYPLTLDPLIGTATQAYAGTDNDFPDVAYDAFSNTYCAVWTQFLGGGQTGVVGSVWLADDLTFGYAFGVNTGLDADSVRVTNIGGTGVFVIVFVTYDQSGNYIEGIAFEPLQGTATNIFTIDGPAGVASPIVSGEATQLDDDCLVAWLDDTYGLLGCSVSVDVQFQVGATQIVQIAGGNITEAAISKQGGDAGLHLVTWVDRPPGAPGWVRAQVVDHDMNLLGPGAWIQNTAQNCGYPAVDGDGFKFLVGWEEQELSNPSASDLRGRIVTVSNNGITSVGGALELAGEPNAIDYGLDVAMLADKFGVTFLTADTVVPFGDDAFVRVVDGAGAKIGDALRLDVTTQTGYVYEHAPRLIGRIAGDPATTFDDGVVAFADQSTSSFDSDVGLQLVEALGPGGPIVDVGGGCGPGGLATSAGPFAVGNPNAPLELYGAQPLAIPFVLLGMPNARVACGVCTFVDPAAWWFVPNTAGTATTSMAIPGDSALLGYAFDFQFLSLNVLYVGCPALPGFAASNIVSVTIGS